MERVRDYCGISISNTIKNHTSMAASYCIGRSYRAYDIYIGKVIQAITAT